MKNSKKQRLERAGWTVGSTKEFLKLSDEVAELIEMRLSLANNLKKRRQALDLTQHELASRLGSSQSRVAKMESAHRTVSIDLLVRSLLALGATRREVGRMIGQKISVHVA